MTGAMYIGIREATIGDAEQIHLLMTRCQSEMDNKSMYVISSARRIGEFLADNANYGYVAYTPEGSIVSFALFSEQPSKLALPSGRHPLHCISFATDRDFRGNGLMSHLLETGFSRGSHIGCDSIWVAIDPRNDSAHRIMMGNGFVLHSTVGAFALVDKGYTSYATCENPASDAPEQHAITRNLLYRRTCR